MRALVTGATGFIGSHLVDLLVEQGWQVRALIRQSAHPHWWWRSEVEPVVGDITLPASSDRAATTSSFAPRKNALPRSGRRRIAAAPAPSLCRAVEGIDVVFHLAAHVSDWGRWREFQSTTIEGTRHLLTSAAEANVGRFVYFSTANVYDNRFARHHRVLTEDAPHDPPGDRHFGYYARSKALAEQLVWRFHAEGRIRVTVLRPTLVYGPRDKSILPRLTDYLRSPLATWIGRGNPVVDPIEVSDVARCALAAATSNRAIGRAYNVSPTEEIGVRDFYCALCRALGISPPRFTVPYAAIAALTVLVESSARLLRLRNPPLLTWAGLSLFAQDLHYDPSRAERELGWRVQTSLDAGLRRYAEWLKQPADQGGHPCSNGPAHFGSAAKDFAKC